MTNPHSSDWTGRAEAVARAAPATPFTELVRLSGLSPAADFCFADWSDCDFKECDLSAFDFTGAQLTGCNFKGAQLTSGFSAEFSDAFVKHFARLDQAELGRVIHRPGREPHSPTGVTPIASPRDAKDWKSFKSAWRKPPKIAPDDHLPVGAIFQDAPFAPEMVVVPAGNFMMGTSAVEMAAMGGRHGEGSAKFLKWEAPQHPVNIPQPFAVGRFVVTFEEWDWAQHHTDWERLSQIAPRRPHDETWGRIRRPVIGVSWHDARAYVRWLSALTGQTYRLLTEAEWEYACRAGTTTPYNTGQTITPAQVRCSEGSSGSASGTVEVGFFPANAWGLHDMHGNIWEWCEDEWLDSYDNAPADGTARRGDNAQVSRVLRGGSWDLSARHLRSAIRFEGPPDEREFSVGFRLARSLHHSA